MSTTNSILPDQPIHVKSEGNLLRQIEESGVKPSDMITFIQRLYPGYEKTLHSKCKNGEKYGIMLRPDAMDAIMVAYAPALRSGHRSDRRKKPRRRLSDALYGALQQAIRAKGMTIQQWIEDLALALITQSAKTEGEHVGQ